MDENPKTSPPCSLHVRHPFIFDIYVAHCSLDKSKELTGAMRIAMARAIHPTLKQLLDIHGEKNVLPSHCFVYGIHLSRTHLSIFVHFLDETLGVDIAHLGETGQMPQSCPLHGGATSIEPLR